MWDSQFSYENIVKVDGERLEITKNEIVRPGPKVVNVKENNSFLYYINKEKDLNQRDKTDLISNMVKIGAGILEGNPLGVIKDFLLTIATPFLNNFIKKDQDDLIESWATQILPETILHNTNTEGNIRQYLERGEGPAVLSTLQGRRM